MFRRRKYIRRGFWLLLALVTGWLLKGMLMYRDAWPEPDLSRYSLPYGQDYFKPSDTRTTTGKPMDHRYFQSAKKCRECHPQIYDDWYSSSHHHSGHSIIFNKVENVAATIKGVEFTRWCAGCHYPGALLIGDINSEYVPFEDTAITEEGITCTICHTTVHLGDKYKNSSYMVAPEEMHLPVFWSSESGFGKRIRNFAMWMNLETHRQDTLKDIHRRSDFCAPCHQEVHPENGLPIQDTFGEWKTSKYNTGNPDTEITCQDCHMAKKPNVTRKRFPGSSVNWAGYEKEHVFRHTFAGLNTGFPVIYPDDKQMKLVLDMLSQAVKMEVLPSSPASGSDALPMVVRVSNTGVGHKFPTGASDIRRFWISVEAYDADGRQLFRSGHMDENGYIDDSAYFFAKYALDGDGEPLRFHRVWELAGLEKNTAIAPGKSSEIPYTIPVTADTPAPIKLITRLRFQPIKQELLDLMFKNAEYRPPVTDIACSVLHIELDGKQSSRPVNLPGLMEQNIYGGAGHIRPDKRPRNKPVVSVNRPGLSKGYGNRCYDNMVYIPEGEFEMGSEKGDALRYSNEPELAPRHVDGFCIDTFEFPNVKGKAPSVLVTWDQADAACRAQGKRLCTEVEWEKACKGTENRKYSYGFKFLNYFCNASEWDENIWWGSELFESGSREKCQSIYGVYDLNGNAWEWTSTEGGKGTRILKGGSWLDIPGTRNTRCATRSSQTEMITDADTGFRCCSDPLR